MAGMLSFVACFANASPWTMHVIDDTSCGADGVKTGDLNADGLPDLVTAWEECGRVRVYLNPGHDNVKLPWPFLEIGEVADPEDAVLFDIDSDGRLEVLVATEGEETRLYQYRSQATAEPHSSHRWSREALPLEAGGNVVSNLLCDWGLRWRRLIGQEQSCHFNGRPRRWLYLEPAILDGERVVFAGSKGHHATVSLYQWAAVGDGESIWRGEVLARAGWVMSLRVVDIDGDGDPDVLYSDRRGSDLDGNGRLDDGIAIEERTRPLPGRILAGKGRRTMDPACCPPG